MSTFRQEKDFLGKVLVPKKAYYGAQTQRAKENFPFSCPFSPGELVKAIVLIKKAAAKVNCSLKLLEKKKARAIIQACEEILQGKFSDQFIIGPYQAGAGTSLHFNVNEVIANRANEILGFPLGSYQMVNPYDEVNFSQSTNDVMPAALRLACLFVLPSLLKNLEQLSKSFQKKEKAFGKILKAGRTHLRDALPLTLGQEFSGYRQALEKDRERILTAREKLFFLGIGGTAVGTGINSHPRYHLLMIKELSALTGFALCSSGNFFESMQNTADFLSLSATLRTLAQTLIRLSNDLRLLSSGPLTGLGEIILPEVQPGSSIMPGKTNPSILEMVTMVCFQVIGFDQAILLASLAGQLELNVMLPLIAFNLLEEIKLLAQAIEIFEKKCLRGLSANEKMCRFWLERGVGLAAILNPYLGYEKTAFLVRKALKTGQSLKTLLEKEGFLSKAKIKEIFSPEKLTHPNLG